MEVFLRTVNHDLRTALNAIVVSTSILKEAGESFNDEQRECVDILEAGSAFCFSLIGFTIVFFFFQLPSHALDHHERA